MADNIYLRAGRKAGMPNLADREPAFVRDERALYIGTSTGNLKLCEAGTIDKVVELEESLAELGEAVEELEGTGTSQGDTLNGLRTELDELKGTVTGQGETQQSHTETLGTHTETLQTHTESLEALQTELTGKLSATAAETLAELTGEEDLAAVISAYNSLIAALKVCGIMSSEGVDENGQTD